MILWCESDPLAYWGPTAPPEQRDGLTTVTTGPGTYAGGDGRALRAEVGADVPASATTEIFAVFKIAVVIQQSIIGTSGQTTDRRFATFDARVAYLARHAAALAGSV